MDVVVRPACLGCGYPPSACTCDLAGGEQLKVQRKPRYPVCCEMARLSEITCICAEVHECPLHGDRHHGTHE